MTPDIPVDIYDSPAEMVIYLPLWWVMKDSIALGLDEHTLTITADRQAPTPKPTLSPKQQQCYRGTFTKTISLPASSFFNGITSTLTPENILIITVPKVLVPQTVSVTIQ